MAEAIGSGSVACHAWFGVGAVLLHAVAVWALPEPSQRITAVPIAFSLLTQASDAHEHAASAALAEASEGAPLPTSAPTRRTAAKPTARAQRSAADNSAAPAALSGADSAPAAELEPDAVAALNVEPASAPDARSGAAAAVAGEAVSAGPGGAHSNGTSAVGGSAQGTGGNTGNVEHGPALLARGNPCSEFFPAHSHVDRGEVQIDVEVDASGHAHASAVLFELPHGEGFASAARECARRLQFAPAIAHDGSPTVGHAKLKLRFKRRTV